MKAFGRAISSSCIVLFFATVVVAATTTHHYTFRIHEFIASPDGGVPRLVKGINGQSPAPDIIVGPGDRIVVTAINALPHNGTTLHWHGIKQTKTNNMDGVPYVTQVKIPRDP